MYIENHPTSHNSNFGGILTRIRLSLFPRGVIFPRNFFYLNSRTFIAFRAISENFVILALSVQPWPFRNNHTGVTKQMVNVKCKRMIVNNSKNYMCVLYCNVCLIYLIHKYFLKNNYVINVWNLIIFLKNISNLQIDY